MVVVAIGSGSGGDSDIQLLQDLVVAIGGLTGIGVGVGVGSSQSIHQLLSGHVSGNLVISVSVLVQNGSALGGNQSDLSVGSDNKLTGAVVARSQNQSTSALLDGIAGLGASAVNNNVLILVDQLEVGVTVAALGQVVGNTVNRTGDVLNLVVSLDLDLVLAIEHGVLVEGLVVLGDILAIISSVFRLKKQVRRC